jgi:hypothetical protein
MNKLKKIYIKLYYLIYLISRVNWYRLFKLYNSKSDQLVWILQDNSIKGIVKSILNNHLLNDLALIQGLIELKRPFKIIVGKKIGPVSGKNIFYTISSQFNQFGLADHSKPLWQTVKSLEIEGNTLYPPSSDALYWENKAYMHREFDHLNINSPKTKIFTDVADIESSFQWPVLLKEVHSAGSAGVIKIKNYESLIYEVIKRKKQGQSVFLLQELLNIRRDLRVVIVNNQIVLHYWRINQASEWKPTSTGHGSLVDFESFPEHWRSEILSNFSKLNLITGAFDVAWQDDDLQTNPIFLEISPAYMPNPPPSSKYQNTSYANYKKIAWPKPKYLIDYINIVFEIKAKVVNEYIVRANQRNENVFD